jgi:RimJ/RimL family protein N-acetyltransferase
VGSIPTPKIFIGAIISRVGMLKQYCPHGGGIPMLKKRDLQDCQALYSLIVHPDVFPYVRHKPGSFEEYLFITKQMIEAEERGEVISRTILDEWGQPIGTISLYDIADKAGFLGTWLGKPYHGKGYNRSAKEDFFNEIFFDYEIENVYLRIKKENIRSIKAAEKLPYTVKIGGGEKQMRLGPEQEGNYELYVVRKDAYNLYHKKNGFPYGGQLPPLEA